MDGSNGSTTFVDSSTYGHTMTAVSNAQISTSNPMFGSGAFINTSATPGGVAAVYTPIVAGTSLDITTGDFTLEGWFQFPVGATNSNQQIILDMTDTGQAGSWSSYGGGSANGVRVYLNNIAPGNCLMVAQGFKIPVINTQSQQLTIDNNWHHWAFVRIGDTYVMYVDGIGGPSQNITGSIVGTGTWCTIGTTPFLGPIQGINWAGQLDEIRVTKGVGRYTGNFTPPTAPFNPYS